MHRTRCRAGMHRRLATALRAASAAVALACAAPALAQDARLWLVAGDVVVVRPGPAGDATRRPITGDAVSAGDRIETGADGRVQMRFSDGSVVSLQPGSRFTIDAYRFEGDAQRAVYVLTRGTLRTLTGAVGKRRHEDYKLITPTATVGVRGTEFVVEETACDPQCRPGLSAGTRVMVSQGRVAVTTRGGTVEVDAGRTVHAPSADRPAAPTTERPVLSSTMPGSGGTVAEAITRAGRVDADAGASAGARFAVLSAQAATVAAAGVPGTSGTSAGGTRRATSAGSAPEGPTLAKAYGGRTDDGEAPTPAFATGPGRVDEPSGVATLPVGSGTGSAAAAIAPSARRDADGAPTLATLALAGGSGPQDGNVVAAGGIASPGGAAGAGGVAGAGGA
ncbi:MAG: FecR domain-containing protein, partial [Burkholderiales bacterium]